MLQNKYNINMSQLTEEYRDKCIDLVCSKFQIPQFDFVDGISKVGDSYKEFVSFEELLSLIVTLRLNGYLFCGVIGSALQSIFESLLNQDNVETLKSFGICSIMDFGAKYHSLSSDDKEKVMKAVTFVNNIDILNTLYQDQLKSDRDSVFWQSLTTIAQSLEQKNSDDMSNL